MLLPLIALLPAFVFSANHLFAAVTRVQILVNAGILLLQDTGKVVSSGKAQRVTMKQILGPAAFSKPAAKNRKKGKGGNDYEGEDDEDDGDAVRYLLGTFVIEVQQPITSQSFRYVFTTQEMHVHR